MLLIQKKLKKYDDEIDLLTLHINMHRMIVFATILCV